MDLNYLKKLLKILDESSTTELSIKEEGLEINLSRQSKNQESDILRLQAALSQHQSYFQPSQQYHSTEHHSAEQQKSTQITEPSVEPPATENYHIITSPIVGTFYRSPSPDSEPFVEIGTHVSKGQTLCIIEAMKLMNEIESDISGTIIKILEQNANPVEYQQPLFYIKPD
jgi:acetyl-CoA carboxylase biotin carboxyl carrier protein